MVSPVLICEHSVPTRNGDLFSGGQDYIFLHYAFTISRISPIFKFIVPEKEKIYGKNNKYALFLKDKKYCPTPFYDILIFDNYIVLEV